MDSEDVIRLSVLHSVGDEAKLKRKIYSLGGDTFPAPSLENRINNNL